LAEELQEARSPGSWVHRVGAVENPFGDGQASRRIAAALAESFGVESSPGARECVLVSA